MKERPILFSAPMVRAILEGRKTQTRRIVKAPPTGEFCGICTSSIHEKDEGGAGFADGDRLIGIIRNPYGQPGDQLWVRELFSFHETPSDPYFLPPGTPGEALGIHYWADGNPEWGNWDKPKPSIHMPRWASRITLEITGLRVERLHAISEEDARAEGITLRGLTRFDGECRGEFRRLWESISGAESWNANPWVWVVEFRRVKP